MKFVTFLNSGCIEICKNMLKSAELAGISKDDFVIYCLDMLSLQSFSEYSNRILYYDTNDEMVRYSSGYENWTFDSNSNFRKVVKHKWNIIKEAYSVFNDICWVDTDIVFKKDPRPIFDQVDAKILCQSDLPGSVICSGFMAFKNSNEAKMLIDECSSMSGEDDQIAINGVYTKYPVAILHPRLFPNGHVYYKQNIKNDAYIVHNNHMVGIETKIEHFKNEGLWFI